ncbi:MAG: GNAT family N-acetyltransferase [Pseudomonadota bacterium]
MNGLIIRPYRASDAGDLADLFHRAVTHGAKRHYSTEQRTAWAPEPPSGPVWEGRLATADTLVAEGHEGLVGFMALVMETGYLDYAYVAPEVMGKGVADTLYAVLEGRAKVRGLDRLETEASRLAERFFIRQGWRIVIRQEVERRGVKIPNARMEKVLDQRRRQIA